MRAYLIDGPAAGQTVAVEGGTYRHAVYVPPPVVWNRTWPPPDTYADCVDVRIYTYGLVGRHPKTGLAYMAVIDDSYENHVQKLTEENRRLRSKIDEAKDVLR